MPPSLDSARTICARAGQGEQVVPPILLQPMQQHGQDVDFEKPANDALELQPYHSCTKGKGLGRKLVARELIVALDWTGDEGREV